jgi:ATP-dependent RNA helicase HelY
LFDGLTPAQLASLVSVFVYESRGPDRGAPDSLPRGFMKSLVDRWWRIADRADRLNELESAADLPLTRRPDPGFAVLAMGWANGRDFGTLIEQDDITGGDLVRTMKALIDLLRQLGEVAPVPETATAARTAAKLLFRGVVSVSSQAFTEAQSGGEDSADVDPGADDDGSVDEPTLA